MTIYLVERMDGSSEDAFEMNCDEPRVAAVEYFEHRGSEQVRDGEGPFMIEVYEPCWPEEDAERAWFECSRDGVERMGE